MKRKIGVSMVASFLLAGLLACVAGTGKESGPKPMVQMAEPVKMDKKAKVGINGSGFKPGQEVYLVFTDKNGIESDIGYALKPAPKADSAGNWSTTWSCGRFIARKLVKAGDYKLTVTDMEYNTLTQTTVTFVEAAK
jgi:hypothetical protein